MTVLLGETWRGGADALLFVLGFVLRCALWFVRASPRTGCFAGGHAGLGVSAFPDIPPRPGDCL
jgi:hypothetical protein